MSFILSWLYTVWKHQLTTVITMLADSFRYILWVGRLQPYTYMFMIANNGRVEMSNHQGEFQYNRYTRRPSLLSPLPSSLPHPSGPSPSSFQDDRWPCHSRIPHRALYRRKVEVTTSSMERVHFIRKTWNQGRLDTPLMKYNLSCTKQTCHAMEPPRPTHPHTHTPSYLSSLNR